MKEESVMLERSGDAKELAEANSERFTHSGSVSDTEAGSDAALGALLEEDGAEADAERRERRLGARLAQLDALNVAGMLAAAAEGGGAGARLAARLEAGLAAGAALGARLRRGEALARGAPDACSARSGAARADASARALLRELTEIYDWLDPPPLQDLDSISEVSLASAEGRARALQAAHALRVALRGERSQRAHRRRLAAVRERLRRLARARDQLAAALARHLNNTLIHLGNEAAHDVKDRHHEELLPYAPFMRWLKEMDEKAFDALAKVYISTWSRVYERELRATSESARAALASAPERADPVLDDVLTFVENLCNAEQDFCVQFFHLDIDVKGDSSDGEQSDAESRTRAGGGAAAGGGGEARRFMQELFPKLEAELVALVAHIEKLDAFGAMRALACVGRRVLGAGEAAAGGWGGAGEARWARGALAAVAVVAKRGADRCIAERIAAFPDAVRQAAKRPKCGLLGFLAEFEELRAAAEVIFARSRRADLDRWYVSLAEAMIAAVWAAEHPRTPRAVLRMENYHRLQSILAASRVPALDDHRATARARYKEALRSYVTTFERPLERVASFFERVAEVVATGAREDEVAYRSECSKHALRRLLAGYPAAAVRRALHRLYRTADKQLSAEGGLLQVVWRALQEDFLQQHTYLQSRIAACYPGSGLELPLTIQDILDAFSDIAREH
ncbi:exocyst complex component 1 [Plodia interpunctella]|uniref:exocyst complex component 1 n=1 Tax=Plodia interpunctella TaxID=58824 RepID=UPI002368D3BE|nr:exocyst complex component 1 [Plodia interpunctella]